MIASPIVDNHAIDDRAVGFIKKRRGALKANGFRGHPFYFDEAS